MQPFTHLAQKEYASPGIELLIMAKTEIAWNFSFEQLIAFISWISLQEDINYPMNEGREGRRMSFYRYIESVFSANAKNQDKYSLKKVLGRTGGPKPKWNKVKELEFAYNAIESIVE